MVDILDKIDSFLTNFRVLTQDELFEAAFNRVIGVDGQTFTCYCGVHLDEVIQIGWTTSSRRHIDDYLYFDIHENIDRRTSSEVNHESILKLIDETEICWRCNCALHTHDIGLCGNCYYIIRYEGDVDD